MWRWAFRSPTVVPCARRTCGHHRLLGPGGFTVWAWMGPEGEHWAAPGSQDEQGPGLGVVLAQVGSGTW